MAVIGTTEATPIGVEVALQLAGEVLRVIHEHPGRPVLLLVDTTGQRLSRRDELLGINRFLGHLAKCIEVARLHGHRIVSLVYAQAVSGGYLSSSMLADACVRAAGRRDPGDGPSRHGSGHQDPATEARGAEPAAPRCSRRG